MTRIVPHQKRKYVSNPDLDGTGVTHSFAALPLIRSWFYPLKASEKSPPLKSGYTDNDVFVVARQPHYSGGHWQTQHAYLGLELPPQWHTLEY